MKRFLRLTLCLNSFVFCFILGDPLRAATNLGVTNEPKPTMSAPSDQALPLLTLPTAKKCQKLHKRREIRELSKKEWADFVKALRILMQRSSPKQGPGRSAYDEFASRDANYSDEAKGYAPFLAFNRLQLKVFESALQAIDSSVDLPYWDWTLDASQPQTSVVLSARFLGGNGERPSSCVKTGPFADYQVPEGESFSCLQRHFNHERTISAFPTKVDIQKIISKTRRYDEVRQFLIYAPTGAVFHGIGGQLASAVPAQDPIYWLHMAFLDKIYAQWQEQDPKRLRSVGGMLRDQTVATADTKIPGSAYAIKDVWATKDLCYLY